MKRTLDQNALFHVWCREIAKAHNEKRAENLNGLRISESKDFIRGWILENPPQSEDSVKEALLMGLGNTANGIMGQPVAMRSSSMKRTRSELTEADIIRGFKPMDEFMLEVQVWALDKLGLELSSE